MRRRNMEEPMRIAHVVSWYVPGLGYEENYLPMEQAAAGNQVLVITSNRLPSTLLDVSSVEELFPGGRTMAGTYHDNGVSIRRLESTPELFGQEVFPGLHRVLKEFKPDIVHAHGALAPISLQTLLLRGRLRYKLVIDDHSHASN